MSRFPILNRHALLRSFGATDGQAQGLFLFIVGILLSILACGLLVTHAEQFSWKRDEAVKIGIELPKRKADVALLRASVAAEKLFAEEGLASREEQTDVYVLPEKSPAPRIAKIAEDIGATLGGATAVATAGGGGFRVERTDFGSERSAEALKVLPVRMRIRGSFQHVSRFLAILGLSGKSIVKDILPENAEETFLRTIEEIAPLSLERANAFLYLDLLSYAAEADEEEQRLLENLPDDAAGEIRAMLLSAGLGNVRSALSENASALRAKNVWPLPLLRADSLSRNGDVWEVEMTAFYRASGN